MLKIITVSYKERETNCVIKEAVKRSKESRVLFLDAGRQCNEHYRRILDLGLWSELNQESYRHVFCPDINLYDINMILERIATTESYDLVAIDFLGEGDAMKLNRSKYSFDIIIMAQKRCATRIK